MAKEALTKTVTGLKQNELADKKKKLITNLSSDEFHLGSKEQWKKKTKGTRLQKHKYKMYLWISHPWSPIRTRSICVM